MSSKKWNQYVAGLSKDKTDDIQIQAIIAYLHVTHGIPREQLKKEYYVIWNLEYEQLHFVANATYSQLSPRSQIIRHPDISILGVNGNIACIIELDGSIHDKKTAKTAKRNQDYEYAKIPYIVLNIADLKELKISWFDFLDEQLVKLSVLDNIN